MSPAYQSFPPFQPVHPGPSVKEDQEHLGTLAMRFRGTRDAAERTDIAAEYGATVARLIGSRAWDEAPPPEDQLPRDSMPGEYFTYWSGHAPRS